MIEFDNEKYKPFANRKNYKINFFKRWAIKMLVKEVMYSLSLWNIPYHIRIRVEKHQIIISKNNEDCIWYNLRFDCMPSHEISMSILRDLGLVKLKR